ncbi:MAG: hypothetical protein NTZ09_07055 [Candidatus Hydrogenedentes bacterium]|nr:hypothetical protein [Candidatus Hydrogenedentota bacterium]
MPRHFFYKLVIFVNGLGRLRSTRGSGLGDGLGRFGERFRGLLFESVEAGEGFAADHVNQQDLGRALFFGGEFGHGPGERSREEVAQGAGLMRGAGRRHGWLLPRRERFVGGHAHAGDRDVQHVTGRGDGEHVPAVAPFRSDGRIQAYGAADDLAGGIGGFAGQEPFDPVVIGGRDANLDGGLGMCAARFDGFGGGIGRGHHVGPFGFAIAPVHHAEPFAQARPNALVKRQRGPYHVALGTVRGQGQGLVDRALVFRKKPQP